MSYRIIKEKKTLEDVGSNPAWGSISRVRIAYFKQLVEVDNPNSCYCGETLNNWLDIDMNGSIVEHTKTRTRKMQDKLFSYQYRTTYPDHPKISEEMRNTTHISIGRFANTFVLEYKLKNWSCNGWKYFLTPEDIGINARAKPLKYELTNNAEPWIAYDKNNEYIEIKILRKLVTIDFDHTLKFEVGGPNMDTFDFIGTLGDVDIAIVTSRTESEESREEIFAFLKEFKIPFRELVFTNGDKLQTLLAMKSDLHLDDDLFELQDCKKAGIETRLCYNKEKWNEHFFNEVGIIEADGLTNEFEAV